ncbi:MULTISPECIES: hypothetical protein [Eisenbergiella]|nr:MULTISPECIES: hypothetical protein [Eisenbergiella]
MYIWKKGLTQGNGFRSSFSMPRREEFGKFTSWSIPIFSGNAVSKRVNWEIRNHRIKDRSGYLVHGEVIETMKVVLRFGYSVIVTYIIEWEVLEDYLLPLKKSGLQPVFRILLPERKICIDRDISRKGWTAGPEFIDKWYEQQAWLGAKMPGSIIDSSNESLEETVDRHFPILI